MRSNCCLWSGMFFSVVAEGEREEKEEELGRAAWQEALYLYRPDTHLGR